MIIPTYPMTTAMGNIVPMPKFEVDLIIGQLEREIEGKSSAMKILEIRKAITGYKDAIEDTQSKACKQLHQLYINMAQGLIDDIRRNENAK